MATGAGVVVAVLCLPRLDCLPRTAPTQEARRLTPQVLRRSGAHLLMAYTTGEFHDTQPFF